MQTEVRSGAYVLHIPIRYLKLDASDEDKDFFRFFKDKLDDIVEKGHGGIILPALTDDQGNRLFDLRYEGPTNVASFPLDLKAQTDQLVQDFKVELQKASTYFPK